MFMNMRNRFLFFSLLVAFVCRAEKATEFSTIEADPGQGKKASITLLLPPKTDLDEFMSSNRMMAGSWAGGRMQPKKGGKPDEFENVTRETKTHWVGEVHYPIFNYRGVRLYMIGGIKIRKSPAIENLPPEEKEVLLKVLRTRGDLILKETGKPNEYDLIGFRDGIERVFSLFTLNNKWTFKDAGKPNEVKMTLNAAGALRIDGERVTLDELAENLYARFPSKVIVRLVGEVPEERIKKFREIVSRQYFWGFDLVFFNDGD
jgi:hypothetical protein